jgi:hypothetical protein
LLRRARANSTCQYLDKTLARRSDIEVILISLEKSGKSASGNDG